MRAEVAAGLLAVATSSVIILGSLPSSDRECGGSRVSIQRSPKPWSPEVGIGTGAERPWSLRMNTGLGGASWAARMRPSCRTDSRPCNSSDLVRSGRRRVAEGWHGWRWLCHIQGMDTEVDLTTVDRAVLIAIIAELQAVIERLQRRIAELEGQTKPGDAPNARPQGEIGPEAPSAAGAPQAATPRLARPRMTPTHRVEHVLPRLRRPPVRRLDPAHSGSHRAAGGSGASHRARLHCSEPGLPTALHTSGGTGRRGPGPAAPRRQPQPDRHAAGRGADGPQRPVVSGPVPVDRLSVGDSPAAQGPNQRWPRSWTASAPAQWSTPTKPAGARTGPMATCGLSAPPPNATSCGGVGARRWWTKRWAVVLRRWSAIATAYHHYDGPKQRCWAHLLVHDIAPATPKTPHWPDWPRQSTSSMSQPPATITSGGGCGLGAEVAGQRPFVADPSVQGKLAGRAPHQELFVFVADPKCQGQQPVAQPAPSGYQPQGQRRHPLGGASWAARMRPSCRTDSRPSSPFRTSTAAPA